MSLRNTWRKGAAVLKGIARQDMEPDPFKQFARWFEEAGRLGLAHPEAMSVATVAADGQPSSRMVLLKDFDEDGFVFYTNYESRKGGDLAVNPRVALLFYWEPVERQVRIEGVVEKVSEEESAAYFASRPRGSRLSAWASAQSALVENRRELEDLVRRYDAEFRGGDVPLPPFWGGYRCVPDRIEFWQGRADRLHDRLCYYREDRGWTLRRLAP